MAEPTLEEYVVNAQNKSNLSITSNDINIELNKEFLVELHKNAYHGWIDEDMMDHIAKLNEGEGKIIVWEELVKKFFYKFYPDSYDGEEELLDEGENWGIDPLEFISRHVGIKRLIDDLRVTAAQLMLLVYKLLLLVLKVNAASTKVTTAQRLRLLKEFLLSEKG
ncbi:hypothetical protein Tco_1286744 [Tanacetum coccineum]